VRRIKALVIPPAWTDVWICPLPNGHIQASARDAKRRKQYRYHARWREVRDENKYDRMIAFGEALPALRKRVEDDLSQPGLSRSKVMATVVRLLELTLIRIGNEEYARNNESYGLTTLRNRHVEVTGATLKFKFRGKSAKTHEVEISDRRLAAVVKRCQALPGYELFQYLDDEGQHRSIDSADVNEYLREATGEEFTAKDFRTWAGSVLAAQTLSALTLTESEAEMKHGVVEAIKRVAKRLGNTPATCRKHYIHPAVITAFLSGKLEAQASNGGDQSSHENALLRLLKVAGSGSSR
jgi:DNA topoisomerase-1